jgi:hypothetical protein
MGALRVIHPLVGDQLYAASAKRVDQMFSLANSEYQIHLSAWWTARHFAIESCRNQAVDEDGNDDDVVFQACFVNWVTHNPEPSLEQFERSILSTRISNADVVRALMGENVQITMEDLIGATLTEQDQVCVLRGVLGPAQERGSAEAALYARLNGAELDSLVVLYRDRAQVYVRVTRPIPTIYVHRFTDKTMTAAGEAVATLGIIKQEGVIGGGC